MVGRLIEGFLGKVWNFNLLYFEKYAVRREQICFEKKDI
jgi:hypothetical protein